MVKKTGTMILILFSLLMASCGVSDNVQVNNAFDYLNSKERVKVQIEEETYTINVDEEFIALFQEHTWKKDKKFVDTPKLIVYLQEEHFMYLYPNGMASIYYGYSSMFEKSQEHYKAPTEVLNNVKEYVLENGAGPLPQSEGEPLH